MMCTQEMATRGYVKGCSRPQHGGAAEAEALGANAADAAPAPAEGCAAAGGLATARGVEQLEAFLQCTERMSDEPQAWAACDQRAAEATSTGAGLESMVPASKCPSSASPPAPAHAALAADAAAAAAAAATEPQRSSAPDDLEQGTAGQGSSVSSPAPITPAAAPSLAALSPRGGAGPATPAASGSCPPAPAAAAVAGGAARATAAALWQRTQSFIECVDSSSMLQSALLHLDLTSTHPGGADPCMRVRAAIRTHWTVAQLLALHLKAGYTQATEGQLLAALWVLESAESVWRSPATVCLNDYLRHLAVFSQEAVVDLTADWPASFQRLRQAVVHAQMDLLKRLDWRVRLDSAKETKPCFELLFSLSRKMRQELTSGGCCSWSAAEAAATTPQELWPFRICRLCTALHQQALVLRKRKEPAPDGLQRQRPTEEEAQAEPAPAKRHCTAP